MIEGNVCPKNYPVFEGGGLHGDLLVDEGTYIVDRDGRVCITTTSNKWDNLDGDVKKWNQGFVRARFLSNEGDFLTYSNQIRLATENEITLTKAWIGLEICSYNMEKTGQFRLF